jgi:hypothetical protein
MTDVLLFIALVYIIVIAVRVEWLSIRLNRLERSAKVIHIDLGKPADKP